MSDISKSVIAATSSSRYTEANYWRDPASGTAFQIQVEIPQNRMQSMADLGELPIMPPGASQPLLNEVAYNTPNEAGGGLPQDTYQTVARMDYNLSDRTQMYGRYALESSKFFNGTLGFSPYSGFDTAFEKVPVEIFAKAPGQFTTVAAGTDPQLAAESESTAGAALVYATVVPALLREAVARGWWEPLADSPPARAGVEAEGPDGEPQILRLTPELLDRLTLAPRVVAPMDSHAAHALLAAGLRESTVTTAVVSLTAAPALPGSKPEISRARSSKPR